jgi:NAD(P)-dependent dehydrogenase (short-subunit alcohol dehydrogenase family)
MGTNLFNLKGKTAVITGGNSGIGLGFAEGVAKHGANLCIWGTNIEKNAAAVRMLQPYGTKVYAMKCDVSDEEAVDGAFAETLAAFGRVDACFANAGVGTFGSFAELPTEDWHRVLKVNLDGLFFTLRAAARHMKQRAEVGDKGGRLIGTSSVGALMGMSRGQAYAGSKGAVISIMQGLAVEFARYGVTANSVLPGHIETAMTEKTYATEKFRDAIMPRIPLRRWGDKTDFEGIAVYLMSDASKYHTADSFLIDGGFFVS